MVFRSCSRLSAFQVAAVVLGAACVVRVSEPVRQNNSSVSTNVHSGPFDSFASGGFNGVNALLRADSTGISDYLFAATNRGLYFRNLKKLDGSWELENNSRFCSFYSVAQDDVTGGVFAASSSGLYEFKANGEVDRFLTPLRFTALYQESVIKFFAVTPKNIYVKDGYKSFSKVSTKGLNIDGVNKFLTSVVCLVPPISRPATVASQQIQKVAGTSSGLYVSVSSSNSQLAAASKWKELSDKHVYCLKKKALHGNVYVGLNDSVGVIDVNNHFSILGNKTCEFGRVHDITWDKNGSLFAACDDGIYKFDDKSQTYSKFAAETKFKFKGGFRSLLWVKTNLYAGFDWWENSHNNFSIGFAVYDGLLKTWSDIKNIRFQSIYSLVIDSGKSDIYAGVGGGYAVLLHGQRAFKFKQIIFLWQHLDLDVLSVLVVGKYIYFGTDLGLYTWNTADDTWTVFKDTYAFVSLAVSLSYVYAGTDHGLWVKGKNVGAKWITMTSDPWTGSVYYVAGVQYGAHIRVSSRSCLFAVDDTSIKMISDFGLTSAVSNIFSFEHAYNKTCIGTDKGFFSTEDGQVSRLMPKSMSAPVFSILLCARHFFSDTGCYIGTADGFYYDENQSGSWQHSSVIGDKTVLTAIQTISCDFFIGTYDGEIYAHF